jgi:serine/threonine protein kinase
MLYGVHVKRKLVPAPRANARCGQVLYKGLGEAHGVWGTASSVSIVSMHRYDKQNKVGEGAFGVVYRATEKSTGRTVALKKIRLGRGNDGVSREAIREIKTLRELDHENIIEVLKIVRRLRRPLVLCWCAAGGRVS